MSEPAAKQRQVNLDEFERRLARPNAPAKSGDDPLAELARLVGNTEDRFKTVFQSRPAGLPRVSAEPRFDARPAPRAPEQAPQRLGGDFAAIEAGLRGSMQPEFHANAHEPDDGEDWLDAPYVAPSGTVMEPPRSRLPLYATAAIILVGMAGIGGSFALKRHSVAPREIATIAAAAGPTKVQATNTDEGAKPDQEASLLDKSPLPAPVAVVNRTEEPVNLGTSSQAAPSPVAAPDAGQAGAPAAGGAAVVPVPAPPAMEAASGQSFGLAGMIEPKKVKTVVVRPDGTIVGNDAPLQQPQQQSMAAISPPIAAPNPAGATPQTASQSDTASAPAAPPPAAPTEQVATPSKSTAKLDRHADSESSATKPRTRHAQAKPVEVADANADTSADATDAAASGKYDVQLAAPASEAEARHAMARLQKQYAEVIGGHRMKYHQASVANKSVYRVRVVGLSHDEATSLCQKVQTKGGSCFVAKD